MTYHAYDHIVPTTEHPSGIPLAYQAATHDDHDAIMKAHQDEDMEAQMADMEEHQDDLSHEYDREDVEYDSYRERDL